MEKEVKNIKKKNVIKNGASSSRKKNLSKKKTNIQSKTRKERSSINNLVPKTRLELILTIVFVVLLIGVIILGIKAISLKKEAKDETKENLVMTILDKDTNNEFFVDLSDLKDNGIKEYKFTIANYKDKNILNDELKYRIDLTNNSTTTIKLYKNKTDNNLLTGDSKTYSISDNKLEKNKKMSDTYYLIIRANGNIKENENISIKISVDK